MSIRINLLPEARLLKLKYQQTRRLTIIICTLIASSIGATLVILLLLFGARVVQFNGNKDKMAELKKNIDSKSQVETDSAWFNAALVGANTATDKRILISQLFVRLNEALPRDVKLTDFSVDQDYKVKASVKAPDFSTVDLMGDALRSYNVTNRLITGFPAKPVFTDIRIDSVSTGKSNQASTTKLFDVTFGVDKELVQKFRTDSKTTTGGGQ